MLPYGFISFRMMKIVNNIIWKSYKLCECIKNWIKTLPFRLTCVTSISAGALTASRWGWTFRSTTSQQSGTSWPRPLSGTKSTTRAAKSHIRFDFWVLILFPVLFLDIFFIWNITKVIFGIMFNTVLYFVICT